jgi:hypothetical protein
LDTGFFKLRKEENQDGDEVILMAAADKEKLFNNFPGLKQEFREKYLETFGDRKEDEAKFWDEFFGRQKEANTLLIGTSIEKIGINAEMPIIPNQSNAVEVQDNCNVKHKVAVEFGMDIYEKYKLPENIMDSMEPDSDEILEYINNHSASVFRKNFDGDIGGQSVIDGLAAKRNLDNEVDLLYEELEKLEISGPNAKKNAYSDSKMAEEVIPGSGSRIGGELSTGQAQGQRPENSAELAGQKNLFQRFLAERGQRNEILNHPHSGEPGQGQGGVYGNTIAQNKHMVDQFYDIHSEAHKAQRKTLIKDATSYAYRQVVGNEYPTEIRTH